MASTPGFEPGPHWWEASALTTAPHLLLFAGNSKAAAGSRPREPKVTPLMRLVHTAKHKTRTNKNRRRGYGGADAWFVRLGRPQKADGPGAVQCREERRPKTSSPGGR